MRTSGLTIILFCLSLWGVAQPVEFPLYNPIHSQTIQAAAQNGDDTHVSYGPLNFDQFENTSRILGLCLIAQNTIHGLLKNFLKKT